MKIPSGWLREFVDTDADDARIAERLTMGGLEVESLTAPASFTHVVVGRVLRVERHPNADRLSVCQVDVGAGSVRHVVCGASNVAPGMQAPCALPGAVLPGGLQIKETTVRGVHSEGMLCSARELGLSEESAGLLALDAGLAPGLDLRQALGLDEGVFELKTTPNRGDCLSVLGVAREVAALVGVAMVTTRIEAVPASCTERLPVRIQAPDLCGRFSGRVLRGLDARAATPPWMRRRLEQSGQRSISALVDISNYVMLELGQPSHVFDLAKVRGSLRVDWGAPGDTLVLLNEHSVELDAQVGVVADDSGPKALAGVMGGASSAVSLDTTDVYLEAAFWWPESIQGRARRFHFTTEAGHRFERGVDFALTVPAIERLTALIVQVCGTPATRIGPVDDTVVQLPARPPVTMRLARMARVLGVEICARDALAFLERLGFSCEHRDEEIHATPPSYRFDVTREVDLIEEVARVHGYDRLPSDPPRAPARMRARREDVRSVHEVRLQMAQAGYQELVNFSFIDEAWERAFGTEMSRVIRVLNPIASQHALMRTQLLAGLVGNLRYNLNRQASRVRSFEIGRAFYRDPSVHDGPEQLAGIAQPRRLAALAFGSASDEQWGVASRPVDFFDVKGDLERLFGARSAHFFGPLRVQDDPRGSALHPGRSAGVRIDGRMVGVVGELHPRLCSDFELPAAPVLFEVDLDPLLVQSVPIPQPVARFPSLTRDIAVWIDAATAAGEVLDDLRRLAASEAGLSCVREVRLFDVFRAPSTASQETSEAGASGLLNKEKSLAFRLVLQDTQRSLAESDADAARTAIVEHLVRSWGARLR